MNGTQNQAGQNQEEITNDTRMQNAANPVQQTAPAPPTSKATPSLPSSWRVPLNSSMISQWSGIPLNSLNQNQNEEEQQKKSKKNKKGKKSRRGKNKKQNKKDKSSLGPYPVVVSPGKVLILKLPLQLTDNFLILKFRVELNSDIFLASCCKICSI